MAPEVCCFDSIVNVSILYSAAFYDFKCIFILGVNASNQTDKLIFILCDNVLMLQSFKVRQLKLNSHAAFPVSRFLSLHPVVFHPHAHRFFPPISSFLFSFLSLLHPPLHPQEPVFSSTFSPPISLGQKCQYIDHHTQVRTWTWHARMRCCMYRGSYLFCLVCSYWVVLWSLIWYWLHE